MMKNQVDQKMGPVGMRRVEGSLSSARNGKEEGNCYILRDYVAIPSFLAK